MRLLHTSDWHLGRGLHGLDLHDAQVAMVRQISDAAVRHDVDAVVIAGDVFDRAVPPVAAVRLWSQALRSIAAQAPVVVISGNHDSAVRLGAGSDLYRDGVHVCSATEAVGTPVVLHDEHGPVAVYPIPFLDPDLARFSLVPEGREPLGRTHAAVHAEALNHVRFDLARRLAAEPTTRSVVVAHAFVTSGAPPQVSDSERDITVGGVQSVPVSAFDGIDYVALGHLHGAQRVDGDRIRYSGSPLRYSFSEVHQHKQVLVVDIDAHGATSIETLSIEQPRGMAVIRGSLDEVLGSSAHGRHAKDWVQVTVTDAERPTELRRRILERFPHAVSIRHDAESGVLAAGAQRDVRVPSAPDDVAAAFVHYVTGGHITESELRVFTDAYEHARRESVGA